MKELLQMIVINKSTTDVNSYRPTV